MLTPTAFAALLAALIGGNVVITEWQTAPEVVRPDPFTGTQARQMEFEIQRELAALRNEMQSVRTSGPVEVRRELEEMRQKLDDCIRRIDARSGGK